MQYSLVGNDDGSRNITVFIPGKQPLVAHSSHTNFDKIVEGALKNDESILELFDVAQTVAKKFQRLTERITTENGRLYLDGDEVANALTAQILRFLEEDVKDWKPLVKFFENALSNPQEHSREQLYDWLSKRDFTITDDGFIIGYKGVQVKNGEFFSINTGKATVDGEAHSGAIPNKKGSVIEMPRSEVMHDPAVGCSTGLHVGTHRYAKDFALGALLEVHVNPRDVVSVPTDSDWEKLRVCRYTVIDTIDAPYTFPVLNPYGDEDDDDYVWGGVWGERPGEDEPDEPEDLLDPQWGRVIEEPVEDLDPAVTTSKDGVSVGDTFEDTDSRRTGRQFKVESIEGDHAVGKSLPANITRKVRINRLQSSKYRKI